MAEIGDLKELKDLVYDYSDGPSLPDQQEEKLQTPIAEADKVSN